MFLKTSLRFGFAVPCRLRMALAMRRRGQHRTRLRQRIDQVFRNQAGTDDRGGLTVQPNGGSRGHERGHALSQEPEDHPRQNVAAAGGRERGRRIGVDGGLPVRSGDHRVRTLQQHDRAASCRRRAPRFGRPRRPC